MSAEVCRKLLDDGEGQFLKLLCRNISCLVNWERKREWFVARSITSEQFIVGETSPIEVDLEPVDKYRQVD